MYRKYMGIKHIVFDEDLKHYLTYVIMDIIDNPLNINKPSFIIHVYSELYNNILNKDFICHNIKMMTYDEMEELFVVNRIISDDNKEWTIR